MEKLQTKVGIYNCNNYKYPNSPFDPPRMYPEYPFKNNITNSNNFVYDSIRNMLNLFGFDKNNYNTNRWNPFGEFIKPKNNVVIKPNLVNHYNPLGFDTDSLLTHGSIIRAVLDYVYIAVKKGTITIGDAPILGGDFNKALELSGINKIIEFYNENSDVEINIIDFRKEKGFTSISGITVIRNEQNDPSGYTGIDLKNYSEFDNNHKKFLLTNYNRKEILKHHTNNKHEYAIPNSVLNADVIINLPKLKSHKKTGMTCALKNIIGICGAKDCLLHHRLGSSEEGGDNYQYKSMRKKLLTILTVRTNRWNPKIENERRDGICGLERDSRFCIFFYHPLLSIYERMLVAKNIGILTTLNVVKKCIDVTQLILPYKDPYFWGNWWGNNTISKTITDLNKIIFYADKKGVLQNEEQRKCFTIVDAIIAGEGEGPLEPTPKECGLLIAGFNPIAVDLVCSEIMGFDYTKMPTIIQSIHSKKFGLFNQKIDEIEIISNNIKCKKFKDVAKIFNCGFKPTKGWIGHIEK